MGRVTADMAIIEKKSGTTGAQQKDGQEYNDQRDAGTRNSLPEKSIRASNSP